MMQADLGQATELTAVLGGLTVAINVALVIIWGFRRLVMNRPTFAREWSLLDAWVGAQAVLILLLMLAIPVMGVWFVIAGDGKKPDNLSQSLLDLRLLSPLTIMQGIAFFAVPAFFIAGKYGKRLCDIGLPPLPRAQDWWAGILLALFLMIVNQAMEVGLTALAEQFRHVPWVAAGLKADALQPIIQVMRSLPNYGPGMLLLAVLAIGVSAGLGEEMLFRGFLFNILKHRFGLAAGLIVSGLLFSLVHLYFIGFLPVVLMGIVLAWVYHNSGSLWIPIIIHATNNSILVLIAYFFPSTIP